jgi:hypothetical protein
VKGQSEQAEKEEGLFQSLLLRIDPSTTYRKPEVRPEPLVVDEEEKKKDSPDGMHLVPSMLLDLDDAKDHNINGGLSTTTNKTPLKFDIHSPLASNERGFRRREKKHGDKRIDEVTQRIKYTKLRDTTSHNYSGSSPTRKAFSVIDRFLV